jgi:hypothetical protein
MQKDMIEANLAQRGALPLPSAALVIDMRGNPQDDVIERLRVEITDLVGEMKVHNMNHWRFLTDFLAFRVLPLLRAEEVEAIRSPQKPGTANQNGIQKSNGASNVTQTPPVGLTGQAQQSPAGSRFQDDLASLISEGRPLDAFRQRIESMTQEINRLRNNRIKAVNDLSTDGIAGQSVGDPTVRVIFLTHSDDRESLLSASAYAAYLKEHSKKSERKGYPSLVSTMVICLDNRGEAGPPANIIEGLSWNNKWEHLDSLIVSEKFGDTAAYMAGAMQTYVAELLLYVLLIIPPLRLKQSPPPDLTPDPHVKAITGAGAGGSTPKGEWISLPYNSYLVGLGSMEHSARWGRRWLNYGLIVCAADILQNQSADDDEELRRSRGVMSTWLSDWRGRVEQAMLERMPGTIQALQAIPHAINVARPPEEVFTSNRFSFSIGETTINDLESYLTAVEQTYNTPLNERAQRLKQAQALAQSPYAVLPPTLQDAVDSVPLIQQHLRDAENKDPILKKATPLVKTQLEAFRVLSEPGVFTGATGAIPRARAQLEELSTIIADFQGTHQQTMLNLMESRLHLINKGRKQIDDLKKHVERIPLLMKFAKFGKFMSFMIFFLAFLLILLTVFFSLAWLEHLIFLRTADPNAGSFLNTAFNLNTSLAAYVVWLGIIALTLAVLFIFRPSVTGEKRSAWAKEITFLIEMLLFAFAGLFFSFSLEQFAKDSGSHTFVSWLGFLPAASGIAAGLALIMIAIEALWFWRWLDYLMSHREQIINDLRALHKKDIDTVSSYISDTISLQILQRAGLTDRNGGTGSYYDRIDHLHKQLHEVATQAKIQKEMAANRLALSLSDTQPGAPKTGAPWLNLDIREEWLDVVSLTAGFQRLSDRLTKEVDELKEFSQLLLRMMGEETPIQIEQQLRERQVSGSREQRQLYILMATLAALVLRFSVAAPTIDSMTPIIERYDAINSQYPHQLSVLSLLIDTLRKRVRDINLHPLLNANNQATNHHTLPPGLVRENISMATGAFATWVQTLWEGKDAELRQTLDRKGILAKLAENNQDAKAVMRRLINHTMLFGRTENEGGDGFLLLAPSPESSDFRQALSIPSRLITDFPDPERLLLFYVQRYVREALFVAEPEPTPPILKINPDTLTFTVTAGITSQSVTIGNTGKASLSWTAELEAGAPACLSLEIPTNLKLAGEAETTFNVHIDATGLTSGSTLTTNLIVNAFDPQTGKPIQGSPVTIPITVNVVSPTMQFSLTVLDFTATPGTNPPSQTIDITNKDSNQLEWTIDKPLQAWLTISPLNGNVAPGETSSVTFSVDITDLTSGTYYANVAVLPSAGPSTIVTAKLTFS